MNVFSLGAPHLRYMGRLYSKQFSCLQCLHNKNCQILDREMDLSTLSSSNSNYMGHIPSWEALAWLTSSSKP